MIELGVLLYLIIGGTMVLLLGKEANRRDIKYSRMKLLTVGVFWPFFFVWGFWG